MSALFGAVQKRRIRREKDRRSGQGLYRTCSLRWLLQKRYELKDADGVTTLCNASSPILHVGKPLFGPPVSISKSCQAEDKDHNNSSGYPNIDSFLSRCRASPPAAHRTLPTPMDRFPDFPQDVRRLIFEQAFQDYNYTGGHFLRICREARDW